MRPFLFAAATVVVVGSAGDGLADSPVRSGDPPSGGRIFQINCNWADPPDWMVLRDVGRTSAGFAVSGKHGRVGAEDVFVSEDLQASGKRETVTFVDDHRVRMEFKTGDAGAALVLHKESDPSRIVAEIEAIELENPGEMFHFGSYMTTDVIVKLAQPDRSVGFSGCYLTGNGFPTDPALFSYKNILGDLPRP